MSNGKSLCDWVEHTSIVLPGLSPFSSLMKVHLLLPCKIDMHMETNNVSRGPPKGDSSHDELMPCQAPGIHPLFASCLGQSTAFGLKVSLRCRNRRTDHRLLAYDGTSCEQPSLLRRQQSQRGWYANLNYLLVLSE